MSTPSTAPWICAPGASEFSAEENGQLQGTAQCTPTDWRFVPGPIPITQLLAAARLGKRALVIVLLLHAARRIARSSSDSWLTLPARELRRFGIDGAAKARAVAALENAGVVEIQRQGRRSLRLRLLS